MHYVSRRGCEASPNKGTRSEASPVVGDDDLHFVLCRMYSASPLGRLFFQAQEGEIKNWV